MGLLKVDTVGQRMLAAHCEAWAVEVATTKQPMSAGSAWQATSTAVTILHASVDAVAERLSDQMHSTAAQLTATSAAYEATDDDEAVRLGAPAILG
jgi:hypothetical protein